MFNEEQMLKQVRPDFPGLTALVDGREVTYLDSAATSLKPQSMIDAVNEYYSGVSSNVHRGKSYALELVSNRYEQARYRTAELLSCSGNEVVFLRNTTEANNVIASGLNLSKNDTVLVCADSHHSHLLPWEGRASVKWARLTDNGALDLAHFYELLETEKPKVVAITHCSNVTGVYNPVKEMIAAAKAVGAITVVDAAQSVPHRKVNVKELDVDFLTFSAHKMLGPTGIGVLYGKAEQLEALAPMNLGGGMVDWVDYEGFRLRKIPHRFEAGTPHISGAYGLGAAIDYLNEVGLDNVDAHDRHLSQVMMNLAQKRDYLHIVNPDTDLDRGAVVTFKIKSVDSLDDIARVLSDSYGIMCRTGHLCAQPYIDTTAAGAQVMRISGYFYNAQEEVERFFDALDELNGFMF